MNFLKKITGTGSIRPGFYHELFMLVLPIMAQNLITSAVSMADVMMLGQVDQTSLAASSLAGQVQFLLNVVYFGLASAVTILGAQYWGKGDRKTIARILGIGLIVSMCFALTATAGALFFPGTVIGIWTNDPVLAEAGIRYLKLVALSYFFSGLSQPYLAVMKSCERVMLSTVISAIALGSNVVLNAVLIFGLLGFPAMGIEGAALATTICRGIELLICVIDFLHQKTIPRSLLNMFRIPRSLAGDFVRYCLPAFINDFMWGLAFSVNSMIMGRLGSDIVAANSVVSVARELATTAGFGISSGTAILLGKEIGEGFLKRAKEDADACLRTSFQVGLLQGLVILIMTPFIPHFVKVSETASHYLVVMMLINVFYQMGQVINTVLIASIFRCGGESGYGMKLDLICMWGYAVPLGLIAAFVLRLPPLIVYMLMCTDEFAKMPFAVRHYKSGSWLRNITRDYA